MNNTNKNEKNSKEIDLLFILLIAIQVPLALLYQAFVIIKIWNWLILSYIPFNLTYTFCIGIDLIFGVILIKPFTENIRAKEKFMHTVFVNYIIPSVALAIAFITKIIVQ